MESLLLLRDIINAAAEGDDDRLKSLSEEDPSVLDSVNEEGASPLMYAATNGRESTVRFLLRHDVSVDKVNKYDWTALQQACYYGHLAVVGQLLEKGADINKTNVWGSTPLLAATESGNMSLVKMLLTHGAKVHSGGETRTQFTPLMAAAQNGHEGIAAVLINHNADPNMQLKGSEYTPLMFAALNGHVSLVRLLLKHGADKEVLSALGQKAVNIAWAVGREDIVKVLGYASGDLTEKLNSSGSGRTPIGAANTELDIFTAVRSGDSAVAEIKQMLHRDRSIVNSRNEHGATPLMYASMRNSPQACRLLLGNGANVNAQDKVSQWTSFMQSVHHGQYAVAKILLDNGADVNIQAKDGSTALEIATYSVSGGNTRMLQLIAEEKQKKAAANSGALPPEGVQQKRDGGDTEEDFHHLMAAVNEKLEGRKSISNPLSQPGNASSGGGSGHHGGSGGVGDMTTIKEELLEESTPPAVPRVRPTPPPFAVSPSADVIMQRVTNSFKDESTASFERPTPTPSSQKVFELDAGSPCATLTKQVMPVPRFSSRKQESMAEDGGHPTNRQPTPSNNPPTPYSGGVTTTPTFGDAPPISRGIPAPPTSRSMPAPPISRGMPAPPTSRGMPAPPISRGMPAPPTSRGMPAPPTPTDLQMSQEHTGGTAERSQVSRPVQSPQVKESPRPVFSRDNPFQHAVPPPTSTSESREPLSKNIQSLLQQHRSLPGQQRSVVQRADPGYRTAFNQFAQQERQPNAAALGDTELQQRSSVDRRKKAWKRRNESIDLPASVPDALRQLGLNQYLELMEENDVDMEAFATMSNEDLLDIGIDNAEDRLKLLNIILKLNRQQTAEAADDRLVYQETAAVSSNGFVII